MAKIAIITDTHFGCRNDSPIFFEHQKKFFSEVFFPYLRDKNITTVLHGGDLFEKRKQVNFLSLKHTREVFLDVIEEQNISLYITIGNHDVFFKNTNNVNSLQLLLQEYKSIEIIDKPKILKIDSARIGIVPWITVENQEECMSFIKAKKCENLLGHFEINGFVMSIGQVCHNGLETTLFDGYDKVWSGHFHNASTGKNIQYLGAPYEMTWGEVSGEKGFWVFDTETKNMEFIKNPKHIFKTIVYHDGIDTDVEDFADQDIKDCFVKVKIQSKENHIFFEEVLEKITEQRPYKMDIVEVSDYSITEDTLEIDDVNNIEKIMEDFVASLNDTGDIEKDKITSLLGELYKEGLRV